MILTAIATLSSLWAVKAGYGDYITTYYGNTQPVYILGINSNYVVANGNDAVTRVWQRRSGVTPIRATSSSGNQMTLAIDNTSIVTSTSSRAIAEYWIHNGSTIRTYSPAFNLNVRRVHIDQDRVVACAMDGNIIVWSRQNGTILMQFSLNGGVTECRPYDQFTRFTLGVNDGNSRNAVYEMSSSGQLSINTTISPGSNYIYQAKYHNGLLWICSAWRDIVALNASTQQVVATYPGSRCFIHTFPYLYTCNDDGTIRVYDLRDSSLIRSWSAHVGGILDMKLNENSLFTSGIDGFIQEWDIGSTPVGVSQTQTLVGKTLVLPFPQNSGITSSASFSSSSASDQVVQNTDQSEQQLVIYLTTGISGIALLFCSAVVTLRCFKLRRSKEYSMDHAATHTGSQSNTTSTINSPSILSAGSTTMITANELSIPAFLVKVYNLDYIVSIELGRGGGGSVYACDAIDSDLRDRSQRQTLVCKIVEPKGVEAMSSQAKRAFFQELSLIYKFRMSPFFVQLYAFSDKPACMILKRYACDLRSLIAGKLKEITYNKLLVLFVLKVINLGVAEMHEADVSHGDIKPANILIDIRKDGTLMPVLTDFGISTVLDPDSLKVAAFETAVVRGASLNYAAPEVLMRFHDGSLKPDAETLKRGDAYALAITTLEMLTRGKIW